MDSSYNKKTTITPVLRSYCYEFIFFSAVAVFSFSLNIYLFLSERTVVGHDTWHYEALQYYFLNNLYFNREVSQWIPYLPFGSPANMYYMICNGVIVNVLSLFHCLLISKNFLLYFYSGIIFEEFILILGTWLWVRRHVTTIYARFIVVLTIACTAVWYMQIFWDFKLFYAIPLVLYFIQNFLDSGRCRWLLFASIAYLMENMGSLAYFLPVQSFFIALYIATYYLCHRIRINESMKDCYNRRKLRLFAILLYSVISVCIVGWLLSLGVKDFFMPFRNGGGELSLKDFLSYGNLLKKEDFFGLFISKSLTSDYQFYLGLAIYALLPIGLSVALNRRQIPLVVLAISLALFIPGTYLSRALFYFWPTMKYFRHLHLCWHLLKIFMIVLAGVGFDALILRKRIPLVAKLVSLIILSSIIFAQGYLLIHPTAFDSLLLKMKETLLTVKNYPEIQFVYDVKLLSLYLTKSLIVGCLTLVAMVSMFICKTRCIGLGIIIILLVHGVDMTSYRFDELLSKTFPCNEQQAMDFRFSSPPFVQARTWEDSGSLGSRGSVVLAMPFVKTATYTHITSAFLLSGNIIGYFRNIYWPESLQGFIKSRNPMNPPSFFNKEVLQTDYFVRDILALDSTTLKVYKDPKLTNEPLVYYLTTNKSDIKTLLISDDLATCSFKDKTSEIMPGERVDADIEMIKSTSDSFTVNVKNVPSNAWLYYSSSFNKNWSATVNDKPVTIHRAFLSFMSLPLALGDNVITMHFSMPGAKLAYTFLGINAFFFVIIVIAVFLSAMVFRKQFVAEKD